MTNIPHFKRHMSQISHISNIPHPRHLTHTQYPTPPIFYIPTIHISNFPYPQHPIHQIFHISNISILNISNLQYLTSPISHILTFHVLNIPFPKYPTSLNILQSEHHIFGITASITFPTPVITHPEWKDFIVTIVVI